MDNCVQSPVRPSNRIHSGPVVCREGKRSARRRRRTTQESCSHCRMVAGSAVWGEWLRVWVPYPGV